jgi:adenylate kinase family enzyme/aminoglycoside phosphotransferase
MQNIKGVPGAYLLPDLLTKEDCERIITASEATGFKPKISKRSGPPVRNNERVLFEPSDELTGAMESRLRILLEAVDLSPVGAGWQLPADGVFLNRKWRINAYASGEAFNPHYDSGHEFGPGKRTLLSLIIYLNDDFQGGETVFFPGSTGGAEVQVRPRAGAALLFHHYGPLSPEHATVPVIAEPRKKYIARTDLTFEDREWLLRRLLFSTPQKVRKSVLLFGVPGAGKSTQIESLARRQGLTSLNFGACIRAVEGTDHPLAARIAESRRARKSDTRWLSDPLSADIFRSHLPPPTAEPLILDGYPRKRSQSVELETSDWLVLSAVHLKLPPEVQTARLAQRAKEGRTTDDLDIRMREWAADTFPLLEHYKKRGLLDEIDASKPVDQVSADIEAVIESRFFDVVAGFLPPEARALLDGYEPSKQNLSKKYKVYRFSKAGDERYLKVVFEPASRNPSSYEGPILATVKEEGFPFDTPSVLSYFSMGPDVNGVISKRVPGITLKEVYKRQLLSKHEIMKQWAGALARIHAFKPQRPEKFITLEISDLTALARHRLATGVVRPLSFSAKYGVAGTIDLDKELSDIADACGRLTFRQKFLTHGDPCAPNFIWSEQKKDITGCVDLSGIGFKDIHWDLAIACWSLNYNNRSDVAAEFLSTYKECMAGTWNIDVTIEQEKIALMYRLARFIL